MDLFTVVIECAVREGKLERHAPDTLCNVLVENRWKSSPPARFTRALFCRINKLLVVKINRNTISRLLIYFFAFGII